LHFADADRGAVLDVARCDVLEAQAGDRDVVGFDSQDVGCIRAVEQRPSRR
jgi:hypothetical protein